MKRFGILATLICLVGLANTAQAVILIDDFTQGPQLLTRTTVGTSNDTATGLPTANIIGGERNLGLTLTNNPLGGSNSASAQIDTTNHLFIINNATLVSSTSTLLYDGVGSGSLGANLTVGANNFLAFDVLATDASLSIRIDVTDTNNNTGFQTQSNLASGNLATFLYSGFTGSINFASVKSILVTFNAPNSADFAGGFFRAGSTVPEPSSFVMATSAALLLGGYSLRRFRKKVSA